MTVEKKSQPEGLESGESPDTLQGMNDGKKEMDLNEYVEVWNRTVGVAIDQIFESCKIDDKPDYEAIAQEMAEESALEDKRGL